jgi:steroid 5-alpha reductase family enzyme
MRDFLGSIISVLIAGFFVFLVTQENGLMTYGIPSLLIIAIASFLIHWLIFIPSYLAKSEKFFDITGTLAYLVMLFLARYFLSLNGYDLGLRAQIVVILVFIWSLRLGIFLFIRVFQVGEDTRFSDAKNSFFKFMMWFTISALWVFLTTINAITLILNNPDSIQDVYFYVGISIWLIGFLVEVIADNQKRQFRMYKRSNENPFISTGLWSVSRHPNYLGEIMIWFGMAIISIPALTGWQFSSLISPIFVYILLTRMSGVKMLEEQADKRWDTLSTYKTYKDNTPVLFPFTKSKASE